jgi:hypothetical protein
MRRRGDTGDIGVVSTAVVDCSIEDRRTGGQSRRKVCSIIPVHLLVGSYVARTFIDLKVLIAIFERLSVSHGSCSVLNASDTDGSIVIP